ncbi:MAG: pirin family protein [Ignavibacteriae bacterium]|nr:pirin family protein [Ignavibacteriota bacterium]
MNTRTVEKVVQSVKVEVAPGFRVRRPLPLNDIQMIDPFLLLDHFGPQPLDPNGGEGVPEHPHRGFIAITYLLDGYIEHKDSVGNKVLVGPGDLDWMVTGSGILHSELYEEDFRQRGGTVHGFQIWLNLPRAHKMTPPTLSPVKAEDIPTVETPEGARVKILAGEFQGKKSSVKTFTPVLFYHVHLPAGKSIEIPVPNTFNAFAYGMAGSGSVGAEQKPLILGELALFKNDGESVLLSAMQDQPADIIVLGGEPLNEPVATYGPFVMNTQGEIRQTILDYQEGKFGTITV